MNGVMAVPQKMSKGRQLTEELKVVVAAFYESDEVSQLCPGRKDSDCPRGKKEEIRNELSLK